MNKLAFHNFSYGVYIVSTLKPDGSLTGCTANSAIQVTSENPTFAVSINKLNYTCECIKNCGKFAVSVLSEKSSPLSIGKMGFFSGKDTEKFDSVPHIIKDSLPIVEDACAYITCSVTDSIDVGTHTVFFGKVIDAEKLTEDTPMTYAYYHNVIKGKAPKNAPTYVGD